MLKVGILVYDGAEEMDFVGVHEVLCVAKRLKRDLQLDVKLYATSERVRAANGMQVIPDIVGYDLDDRGLLVMPGGRGRTRVARDKALLSVIREFASSRYIASVCTGALILHEAGILKGKKVTTHHAYRHLLREAAAVLEDRVVVDGNILTAGGVTCSIDLGLTILERFFDEEIKERVAARIEYPPMVDTRATKDG